MHYIDKIYGEFEITEPVLLDLINSPTLQRLKGIDPAGYFDVFYPGKKRTRFEHSMGVFLLLRMFGASLEEQIAGLIHDVSHSAFSHCIDYALDEGSQKEHSHQDNIFEVFVRKTDIPDILEKHGIGLEFILDDGHFPLKEKSLPDICADRIDYAIRDGFAFGFVPNGAYFTDYLMVKDGQWVFLDFEHAYEFARYFGKMNNTIWSGFPSACMFLTVGEYLRYALQRNYITEDGLYRTDEFVLRKIAQHHDSDAQLTLLFDRMNNRVPAVLVGPGEGKIVNIKSRVIDPFCYHDGVLQRVSDIEPSWRDILFEESKPKEYSISFER